MPRPSKGFQVRLTASQKEDIKARYLRGDKPAEIIRDFDCGTSNFWLITKGLRHEAANLRVAEKEDIFSSSTPAQLGWVAGIIDGEGWVGISKNWNKTNENYYLAPCVSVSSTTRSMQDELQRLLEFGSVHRRTAHQKRKPNEKPQFTWAIWSVPTVMAFLKVIEPYLIVKRRVSYLVRTFCEGRMQRDQEPYSKVDWNLYAKVRKFNSGVTVLLPEENQK